MKKILILSLILLSFSSCSINGNDDDLFNKKKYCAEIKIEGIEEESIQQKFYSKKRESCLYYTIEGDSHRIYDSLTKEFITGTLAGENTNLETWRNFQQELKELKGE